MSFKNKARQIRNKLYCLPWKTTKLRGAVVAISYFSKVGRVVAFGDGEHDIPLIQYFGGKVVKDGLTADNEVRTL